MDMKTPVMESTVISGDSRKFGQMKECDQFDSFSFHDLILTPLSRRPLRLSEKTIQAILDAPISVKLPPDIGKTGSNCKQASIIIVTFNNPVITKLCLQSLLANTDYSNYEVIVVDNSSDSETVSYLKKVSRLYSRIRVIYNDRNLGFAAANNQGLKVATGEILVLLNNDTIVSPGWLAKLVKHLENRTIGLLGPVTNRIGNEAEIETSYQTYGEMIKFARKYTERRAGELFDIHTLCMFCLAMRRDTYEHLGALDEQYEKGMLEDDDYSMRAHRANYRIVCAEDVFVHHFGKASFGNLFASGEYGRLLEANQQRFEKKWGVKWQPYNRRLSRRYLQASEQIREAIRAVIPNNSRVLVVSKGDEKLLELNGIQAFHFPQNEQGEYAGYYPADSREAIKHLENLRRRGADFLVFPESAFWWLEHYSDFNRYLNENFCVVGDKEETCKIYALGNL